VRGFGNTGCVGEQGGGDEGFAAPAPRAAATPPQLLAAPDRGGGGGGGACGGCGSGGSGMRGGGRGGGGRQPYPAPDGADAAVIPAASRKMVQSLKGILADRSEGEIYATLCDCGMDPDIAVERLISQGMLACSSAFSRFTGRIVKSGCCRVMLVSARVCFFAR